MKQLTCEMCGGTDLVKQDGMFVCQACGCKYSAEEAKRMIVEGSVNVSGSTVKVDTSGELANLYQIARRARDDNNSENAAKYYDMILVKDPTSWEAAFYVVYFKAMGCKIAEIRSAGISVANCVDSVLKLIKNNVNGRGEQIKAVEEVTSRCTSISTLLYNAARDHYNGIDVTIAHDFKQQMLNNCSAAMQIMYILGDNIDLLFGDYEELHKSAAMAWQVGIIMHSQLMVYLAQKEVNKNYILQYVEKVRKYIRDYQAPTLNTSSSGCYVATAIYGSYDCPQVWTLRRYRDYTLAETWYGRAFIHLYYAVSPTLVKWFGHTAWFKKMWKPKLDKMVETLNQNGVADTPYEDKNW